MSVTRELIESHIYRVDYIDGQNQPGMTLTVCKMRMINDFEIVGTAACCLTPHEFDYAMGRELAYEDAIRQAMQFEVYHMAAEKLNQTVMDDAQLDMAKRHGLSFGEALEHLKVGGAVCRRDWHQQGKWLSLSNWENRGRMVAAEHFWSEHNAKFAEFQGGHAYVTPSITMKTENNTIQMGWTPSQDDMLAEDWEVIL